MKRIDAKKALKEALYKYASFVEEFNPRSFDTIADKLTIKEMLRAAEGLKLKNSQEIAKEERGKYVRI